MSTCQLHPRPLTLALILLFACRATGKLHAIQEKMDDAKQRRGQKGRAGGGRASKSGGPSSDDDTMDAGDERSEVRGVEGGG